MPVYVHDHEQLARGLRAAGIRYEMSAHLGRPIARFRAASRDDWPVAMTAHIAGSVLAIVAPDVGPPAADPAALQRLDLINQSWGIGRAFDASVEGGGLCLAVGVYIGALTGGELPTAAIIRHVCEAAARVRAGSIPPRASPRAAGLPPLSLGMVARRLRASGHDPYPWPHRNSIGFVAVNELGRAYAIEALIPDEQTVTLRAAARTLGGDEARVLAELAVINARTGVGVALLDSHHARASYRIDIPLAWVELTPTAIDWHVARLVASLEALERRLGSPSART